MLEFFRIFLLLSALNFTGLATPGPLAFLLAQYALDRKIWEAFWFVTGILVSDSILIVLFGFGMSYFFNSPHFTTVVSVGGGIFLLSSGILLFRSNSLSRYSWMPKGSNDSQTGAFALIIGFLATILNSGYWLWWGTVGMNFLSQAMRIGSVGLGAFLLAIILPTYGWFCILYLLIAKGKNVLSDKAVIVTRKICGLFLIGFGVWFFAKCLVAYPKAFSFQ